MFLRFEVDEIKKEIEYPKTVLTETKFMQKLWNSDKLASPTVSTSALVTWCVTLYCKLYSVSITTGKRWFYDSSYFCHTYAGVWCFFFAIVITQLEAQLFTGTWWTILLLCISIVLLVGSLVIIQRQPISSRQLTFKVPFVPWLPGISILVNIYLMMMLDSMTWVRFAVWIVVGLAIYFGYGIWRSKQRYVNVPQSQSLK